MGGKIFSLGEALIDFIPEVSGEPLKEVVSFRKAPGGAPANVAAAVAKLGGESYFVGKVGEDAFGEFLTDTLVSVGVKEKCISKTAAAKTALAFVSLKKDGERDFMFYRDPSADMLLAPEDIDKDWFASEDILHFGSISLIGGKSKEATLYAITEAKKNGTMISYDPNLRLPLWPSETEAKNTILEYFPLADIVKISDDELEFLVGKRSDDAVMQLFVGDVKVIFVTMGSKGAKIFTKESILFADSYKVESIDATGAGDAFWGSILCKFIENGINRDNIAKKADAWTLKGMVKFANAAGAITTMKRGAISALPTKKEVLEFIEGRDKK